MRVHLLILLIVQLCIGANLPIYKPVSSYACTTLGDSEKSIGCTSSRGGNSGPLWPIETEDDFNDFVKNHGSPKKILVVNSTLFTKDRVKSLIATDDVAGILVAEGAAPPSGFSPVSQFPNKQYGLHSDSDYVWNPLGDEFAFEFFNVPMAALSSRKQSEDSYTSDDILTQARINKIEGGYPQWAVTLDTWMHSSGDADVCIPRGQCQPLGGKSVWSSLGGHVNASKKLVFVSSSLDSNAFFHELAIGADAHIASVISILLTVNTLARVKDIANLDKQIVFGLFAGESWGYLGSNKFVDDVMNFNCKSLSSDGNSCTDPYRPSLEFQKIKLSNIDLAIDIDQIGSLGNTLFVHKEKSQNSSEISKFISIMQENTNSTVQLASTKTPGIPPSSLMPFIQNNNNYPGIVIADFNEQYSSKYYHSRFDNQENINVDSICNVANLLSKSLYSYASGNNAKLNENITVDCNLAKELVYCLTVNMSCEFATPYLQGLSFDSQPTQYTSVWYQNLLLSITAKFIHDVMGGLTATSIGDDCDTLADCKGSNDLCLNGKCIASTTYYHDALSLAFELTSNGWSINKENSAYSTWTESNWDGVNIKVFQMDSPVADVVVFVFGIINILASVVVVYLLRQYLEKRFKTS